MGAISLILLLAGGVVVWALPGWQARHHNKLIRENGSKDTLKKLFHHKWFIIRSFIIVGTAVIVHLPIAEHHTLFLVRVALFTLTAFAWFGWNFTPLLNQKRNIDEWYVSRDPRAAFTDRSIMWLAGKLKASPETVAENLFHIGVVITLSLYFLTYIKF